MTADENSSISARRAFIGGAFVPATVRHANGVITAIDAFDPGAGVVVPDTQVLLPGLVDSHVHLDEPGRTSWEGFETGTAAAAAGGVTTVFDMPLNSLPVTVTPTALAEKRAATAGKLAVDVGYWGGAVPENLGSLGPLLRAGVVGVKCFLAPSGIDEFGHLDSGQVVQALAELAESDGLLIVHAEDPAHIPHHAEALGPHYADFLASRPPEAESAAIRSVIEAARATGGRVHIVHVSDGSSLDVVRAAKADGVRITVETCPHYLTLDASRVPDASPAFKCCPPIRDAANQELLWEGVADGTIDAIVSDHSPSTLALKERGAGDFGLAWGGISGLQTGLRAVWTHARRRGIALETIVPLMSTGPARVAGVERGEIAPGQPAHLTVFDPDAATVVDAELLEYRNKISPWHDESLTGDIRVTYVHGVETYRAGAGVIARAGREVLAPASRVPLSSADDDAPMRTP